MKDRAFAKGELIIAETVTSVWNYHLRIIGDEGPKFGGGAPDALCGKQLGWDTKFPLDSWGYKDHIPSSYCKKCEEIAKARKLVS